MNTKKKTKPGQGEKKERAYITRESKPQKTFEDNKGNRWENECPSFAMPGKNEGRRN